MRTELVGELSAAELSSTRIWRPAIPSEAFDTGKLLSIWVLSAAPALIATSQQYTWSLLLFVGPLALTTWELNRRGALKPLLPAFGLALLGLVPMGGILTVGLADDFFVYPEPSATLGITIPAVNLTGIDSSFRIPIEELAFYLLGFAALLALYAWADTVLFPRARAAARRLSVSLPEVLLALGGSTLLCAGGWAVQRISNPGAAVPGYWLYLMLVPVPVVIAFGPAVAPRINWHALLVVCLALWGHSVLWEVSLAVPQGWWGYQPKAMLGLIFPAWHDLPLEAVVVWLLTPFATIIAFEAIRARLAAGTRRSA